MFATVGLDIGGTKTLVRVVLPDGTIRQRKFRTGKRYGTLRDNTLAVVRDLLPRGCKVGSAAASVAAEFKDGVIVGSGNLPRLIGLNLADKLSDALDAPCDTANDCYYGALAEVVAAGQPVVYITWSTGIGGAFALNAETIYDTALGHMTIASHKEGDVLCGCGGKGHWEALAGGANIEKCYGMKAVKLSDPTWGMILTHMATGVRNTSVMFPGRLIVMGGSISLGQLDKAGRMHSLQRLVARQKATTVVPEIRLAHNGNDSCIEGALIAARRLAA